ncbi:Major Facilitator Superfamily transporter [Candidatus Rhodobacter oscarellae]|uniref:Major Facilitator Superfamily transporter n=1 Tax=Candidatus Rhodobacter oscarellae TaxID=1675527 RepID=A0A0J9H3J0_9RHOB|nr:MFS transporter [Candidatus Rhodobacter lobularis]KMW60223.1 Major Facilitator Superfamily transporter [Candidatus Rhodobacter lobularis]
MSQPSSPAAAARAGIIGAIACATIFSLTIGLTYPLLSFVLEAAGHDKTAIGLNAAMTPIGVLLASPFYPRLVRRVGAWPVAVVCLAVSGLVIALLGLTQSFVAIMALRFCLGVVDVGVFIVSETWINQLASPRSRGRVIGLYATALSAGFGLGPLILSFAGVESYWPFAIGAGLCGAAIPLVLAIRRDMPSFAEDSPTSSWAFLRRAPVLLAAVAAFAFWDAAILALFPVYGLESGLGVGFIAIALSVCILGNTFLQIPLGWASDRTSRRGMMILCACLGVAGALALPAVVHSPALFLSVLFVWGAVAGGLYTMAMSELGDRFEGGELVAGNAAFALAFGIGGVVGAPATGVAMELAGTSGFSLTLAALFLFIAVFAFWRQRSRSAP